jgi:hypothetical protein
MSQKKGQGEGAPLPKPLPPLPPDSKK